MGYKSGRLFEVPISDNGRVVVTRLGERVYMLMWNSAPDNRLTTVIIPCPLEVMSLILCQSVLLQCRTHCVGYPGSQVSSWRCDYYLWDQQVL
jgi:hypothetical protein